LKKNKKKTSDDRGKKVPNLKHEKLWKVPKDAVGFFFNHLAKYNFWMKGAQLSFHYHSQGFCWEDCNYDKTHDELPGNLK
jgi:hypothetical protein